MKKDKPLGMRIGESAFSIGYLLFALVASIVFLSRRTGPAGGLASTCAAMTLLLGCGDAFHLVPRILGNVRGAARSEDEERSQHFWLGLGNLVSSITMTVFYVLLFDAARLMPVTAAYDLPNWAGTVRLVLVVLAALRVALCLFPQNRWFDGVGSQTWGILRNVPFVAMGIVTVWYLVAWYGSWLMAALVTASFACYMGVVLMAREKPMMGMLMLPKTICYIWIIALFLRMV